MSESELPQAASGSKQRSLLGHWQRLDGELWLAGKFLEFGVDVFDGTTDPALRKARIAEAIVAHGLSFVIVGRKDGKPVTFAQAYERLYGA